MLEVKDLYFSHSKQRPILNGLSFSLEKGDVLCILGPNGVGKSTLIRCLLGIYDVQSGDVYIHGSNMKQLDARQVAQKVAYVPQSTTVVFPYSVFDMVIMGRNPHIGYLSAPSKKDQQIANDIIKQIGISHLKHRVFSELSGGEKQMALVARALVQQADIMIMDEPTASLDYGNESKILRLIKQISETGISIVLITHAPNHAFLAGNKVAIMKGGRIQAYGSPSEVITSERLSALYATPIEVTAAPISGDKKEEARVCVPLL
ncbi:hypothetical protein BEP19_02620 [Ammoniphilus oxalaticus]|uniref:ABC transporter domain-containing protein n=1 Tax=Ammoniphilus oxalaticus TaxID=66863 RepID=A0A419SNH8_9BACL|nr:ABC transporter ATP-binding protein [Ammoniphilus oxalaticus]RKD25846.1 hypothetical protein BEP19_02620 [Ammoniphilus oxalaticus]